MLTKKKLRYGNNDSTGAYGPGYQYSCLHSDSNEYSGGDTVWYNYAIASAGTIADENTTQENPANNINTAVESICPNGWTLPTIKQTNSNRDVSNFSPVYGGSYFAGGLYNKDTHGLWWGSDAMSGPTRNYLGYANGSLYTDAGIYRYTGRYIRCVSEEKTTTDLTYMQDMTPEIAAISCMYVKFERVLVFFLTTQRM